MDELISKIAQEMGLTVYETEMLKSDVNNLRGDEWLEEILECCSHKTFKEFCKMIKAQ